MFCTTYVQTLYREVQVWTVSRLSHALPDNGIKKSMCCKRDRKLVHKWPTISCGEIYHTTDKTEHVKSYKG